MFKQKLLPPRFWVCSVVPRFNGLYSGSEVTQPNCCVDLNGSYHLCELWGLFRASTSRRNLQNLAATSNRSTLITLQWDLGWLKFGDIWRASGHHESTLFPWLSFSCPSATSGIELIFLVRGSLWEIRLENPAHLQRHLARSENVIKWWGSKISD